ncbi:hypothetical protein [Mangrovibacterium sp.]|uniref:hypothetical protein n=1 Tax=Mangrovibacterium sp. TaxID=1961364 RepID=UPI0035689B6D
MKAQLLKDLQGLQSKADSFFTEAQDSASEHGAGYFYIAKKIDKIIGYVTGTRDQKKLTTLTELRKNLLDIASEYGAETGIDYGVSLSIECSEKGEIFYSCEIKGTKKSENRDRYSDYERIYSRDNFNKLITEFKELLDIDRTARMDTPESEKDVTVA